MFRLALHRLGCADQMAAIIAAPPPEAVVPVAHFRIERGDGYTMPCVTLADRRSAARPVLRWVFQRHLEIALFSRTDGGSTG